MKLRGRPQSRETKKSKNIRNTGEELWIPGAISRLAQIIPQQRRSAEALRRHPTFPGTPILPLQDSLLPTAHRLSSLFMFLSNSIHFPSFDALLDIVHCVENDNNTAFRMLHAAV